MYYISYLARYIPRRYWLCLPPVSTIHLHPPPSILPPALPSIRDSALPSAILSASLPFFPPPIHPPSSTYSFYNRFLFSFIFPAFIPSSISPIFLAFLSMSLSPAPESPTFLPPSPLLSPLPLLRRLAKGDERADARKGGRNEETKKGKRRKGATNHRIKEKSKKGRKQGRRNSTINISFFPTFPPFRFPLIVLRSFPPSFSLSLLSFYISFSPLSFFPTPFFFSF